MFSDHRPKPEQVLPEVGLEKQASYQAGAGYSISPDEQRFIRDQHLFAGCNILVLYKIEPDGHVRVEQRDLVDLALKCVVSDLRRAKKRWSKLSSKEFFHWSGEDVEWDPASDGFRFKLFARPDPPSPSIHDTVVHYDLKTHKMTHENISLYDSRTGDDTETLSIGAVQH